MNTRSSLLTVGVSALLVTGSAFAAAPATAAPGSSECLTAQAALGTQLGVASADLTLANQIRASIAVLETVGVQLEALYVQAEASVQDEVAAADAAVGEAFGVSDEATIALNAAIAVETAADLRLQAADTAVDEVPPGDDEALALAVAEQTAAQEALNAAAAVTVAAQAQATAADAAVEAAITASEEANAALEAASIAAYSAPEITALEAQGGAAATELDAALVTLGATPGTDPEQLVALADATIAACSGVAVKPAVTVAAQQQQRGLNIQTAAVSDAGATDPANVAFLLGLAGLGAVAAAGAVVVVRRRSVERG
ncbi:hypothetical protein BJ994_001670 [Arthrobacter pigmenti]|uniref:Gram-positive cocci surface proteins LPxTG domain-containing protein n=1 Tax=Arthrobacter pigmenti TaxID=271432 RepID=A0A846RQB9_9MICC|nr:hypothetical protein [Arthrobacter pigmenti]NJC22594.1 hypothetical protein [Arthrobacter pigmenti]